MKTIHLGEYKVLVMPALQDNFIFAVCRNDEAVLIDAGEAAPVLKVLEEENLRLLEIFITHTHLDHVGGCRTLCDQLGVLANSPAVEEREFSVLGTTCRSISTPGHVLLHKVYYFPELDVVFTGDTLINGACGRLLGGTAEQLFESLQKIKALPSRTRIFGAHDYLLQNMEFALSVKPENSDMKSRSARYHSDPTAAIFATLDEEKKTNPFLRAETLEEFTELRHQKDHF